MGLACRQPYRQAESTSFQAGLQRVNLVSKESRKVSGRQQKQAFPPNFVHSLDAAHMAMTAELAHKQGISFAAVHDSYWCHARDIDTLNSCIREAFIDMYSQPILERVRADFISVLGEHGLEIPKLPPVGDLDIEQVRDSPFFFH